jgi:hypothetical protein
MTGRLAPSGDRFLSELSKIAQLAVDTAVCARERLTTGVSTPEDAALFAERFREVDRIATEVTTGASRALVPPIDGEDAAALAARLRDVVVAARSAARLAGMIPSIPTVAPLLADLLVEATDSLEGGATTLTDRANAVAFARNVRCVVCEGERAYIDIVASLLTTSPAALDAVRQREMYSELRVALHACALAGTLVESIALKRF